MVNSPNLGVYIQFIVSIEIDKVSLSSILHQLEVNLGLKDAKLLSAIHPTIGF
ncbi:hypothetical protein [Calothrix sp. CCY 0018]|uniref:hypothetical protein n=1 Tax=Calothrix sp. CCY 0018 TaxID=3103864 RepID=UPI0039C70CC0